jgi:hypothetical protein
MRAVRELASTRKVPTYRQSQLSTEIAYGWREDAHIGRRVCHLPPMNQHIEAAPRSRHFTCRLPEALVTELRALARANDRTTGAEARRAIAAHLAREAKAKPE